MPDRPNLVFLMPDQLRSDFLGCYGARFVATPNVDALAARGVRFAHAYSEHPVCVPARVSLMLGMHALACAPRGAGRSGLHRRSGDRSYVVGRIVVREADVRQLADLVERLVAGLRADLQPRV